MTHVCDRIWALGPIEMSPEVLAASGSGMRSFTDTTLMEDFGKSLEMTRKTFLTKTGTYAYDILCP